MRLTKFNPETGLYEYVKKAKTLNNGLLDVILNVKHI